MNKYWPTSRFNYADTSFDSNLKIYSADHLLELFFGPPHRGAISDFDTEFTRRPIENVKYPSQIMIHILDHHSDDIVRTMFNRPGQTVYREDIIDEKINGLKTFDFMTPYGDSSELKGKNRIIIPDENHTRWKEFIINETEKVGNMKEVRSEGSAIELKGASVIDPGDLVDMTLAQMVDYCLGGSDWFRGFLDVDPQATMTIEQPNYTNPYDLLVRIANLWGLELDYHIQIEDYRVTGRYIDIKGALGDWRGKEIVTGKDLIQVKRKEVSRDIVTALKVIGPDLEREETDDGIETDKEKMVVYVRDEEARRRWSRTGAHVWDHHEPEIENDNITEERLETIGLIELNKRINSQFNYEVDAVTLEHIYGFSHEQVRLGDDVRIKDTSFIPHLYMDARVIEIRRSLSDPSQKTFVLGEFIVYNEDELDGVRRDFRRRIERQDRESARDAQRRADKVWTKAEERWREAVIEIEEAERRLDQAEQDLKEAEEQIKETDERITEEVNNLRDHAIEVSEDAYEQAIEYLDDHGLKHGDSYNGVSITPNSGFLAVRSNQLVRTIMNATDGFAIQRRGSTSGSWTNVLYANTQGDLYLNRRLVAEGGGIFDGEIMARGMTLTGTLTAQNATITGTINGSNATLQSITARNATMIDATIQSATITGNLIGGSIDVITDARIGNNIYLGNQNSTQNKYMRFANDSMIRGARNGVLEFIASNIMMQAEALNFTGNEVTLPQVKSQHPGSTSGYFKYDDDNYMRIDQDGAINLIINRRASNAVRFRQGDVSSANEVTLAAYTSGSLQGVTLHARTSRLEVLTAHSSHSSRNYQEIRAREFSPQSSRESKKDIEPFEESVLDDICAIKTYWFKMQNDIDSMDKSYGFISEEMPDMLTGQGALKLTSIVAYLWKAVQELNQKIDLLEAN